MSEPLDQLDRLVEQARGARHVPSASQRKRVKRAAFLVASFGALSALALPSAKVLLVGAAAAAAGGAGTAAVVKLLASTRRAAPDAFQGQRSAPPMPVPLSAAPIAAAPEPPALTPAPPEPSLAPHDRTPAPMPAGAAPLAPTRARARARPTEATGAMAAPAPILGGSTSPAPEGVTAPADDRSRHTVGEGAGSNAASASRAATAAPRAALSQELGLLAQAAQALDDGDLKASRLWLDRYDAEVGGGALRAEALALRALVSCAAGDPSAARPSVAALEREAPGHPALERLRRGCAAATQGPSAGAASGATPPDERLLDASPTGASPIEATP